MTAWENIDPIEVFQTKGKTHRAMIRLAPVSGGWIWASDASRLFGDHMGWGDPLGRSDGKVNPNRFAPTRQAALDAAVAHIRDRMPDKPITDWLDTLTDEQPDLFGAAA